MPHLKINARTLPTLKAPDPSGKQTLHWDTELKGFAVLCSGVSNARTFIAQRDMPNGKTRRVTVGAVNEIELDKARERAADTLDDLRRGKDPKIKSGSNMTLAETFEAYLAANKDLRPASIRTYRFHVEHSLAAWRDLPLAKITAEMVEARHRDIGRETKTSANAAMRVFRLLWKFLSDRVPEMPDKHPVLRLRKQWYKERPRTRVVRVDNLAKFYESVDSLQNPIARDFILLLLFTGLRIGEARTLRWDDIDLKNGVIHIPASRTKSDRDFELPVCDFVHDMLIARRAIGNAGWVFPAPSKSGHVRDVQYPLAIVEKETGVLVSAHDLRRTFITVAESCDMSPIALKSLVNHSTGKDVTGGYVQITPDRLRKAAQRVGDELKTLCGLTEVLPEGVTKMKKAK